MKFCGIVRSKLEAQSGRSGSTKAKEPGLPFYVLLCEYGAKDENTYYYTLLGHSLTLLLQIEFINMMSMFPKGDEQPDLCDQIATVSQHVSNYMLERKGDIKGHGS